MNHLFKLAAFLTISTNLLAGGPLGNASVKPIILAGNDIVFDSTRNVFYMSVPSKAGFPYGNSIVTINPGTAEITHSTFVGSEPNKLAISSDASRIYVGLNGADGFCWWQPATDSVGALVNFTSSLISGPYVADDLAVAPNDSHTIIVSKNDVSSSAAGDIEVFKDTNSVFNMNLIYGAESISFSDANTLLGYNSYTSGYDVWKWSFNGTNLTEIGHVGNIGGVRIKSVNGLIFFTYGQVLSVSTLSGLGAFYGLPISPVVEPVANTNIVYFLGLDGYGNSHLQLSSFDRNYFLKIDSKTFTNITSSSVRSLVFAKSNTFEGDRLGYILFDGSAGIISIPPPVFAIEDFRSNGSDSELRWSSEIGKRYHVQWSSDLKNWTTFITNNATQYDTTNTFNSISKSLGHEFYRVVQE